MKSFIDGGFRNAELKALNFVRKFIQAITLADIATVDGKRISFHAYAGVESNGLRKDLLWPEAPTKEEMPSSFITLWKSALKKCFINHTSSIDCRISAGKELGDWIAQDIEDKWVWWSVSGESRINQQNNDNWSYYRQVFRRYYLDDENASCPLALDLPISVVPITTRFCIEGPAAVFSLLPPVNVLSKFEDDYFWSTLQEGFDNAIIDQTILLDTFCFSRWYVSIPC